MYYDETNTKYFVLSDNGLGPASAQKLISTYSQFHFNKRL